MGRHVDGYVDEQQFEDSVIGLFVLGTTICEVILGIGFQEQAERSLLLS